MNDLGCFPDLDDGAKGFLSLDSHQYESNDMTVNMCVHSCFQQGKMIFIRLLARKESTCYFAYVMRNRWVTCIRFLVRYYQSGRVLGHAFCMCNFVLT